LDIFFIVSIEKCKVVGKILLDGFIFNDLGVIMNLENGFFG
jgi:hypothetical protein